MRMRPWKRPTGQAMIGVCMECDRYGAQGSEHTFSLALPQSCVKGLLISTVHTGELKPTECGKLSKLAGIGNTLQNSGLSTNLTPEPIFLTTLLSCLTKKLSLKESLFDIISYWLMCNI